MAKRDKLYTVNKWNRPFFEEELRRKKLFSGGGDTTGIIPGLNLNQAWKTFGLGKAPGVGFNYTYNMPFYTTQDNIIGRDAYVNPYQEMAKTYAAPTDLVSGGGSSGTSNSDTWEKVLDNITNATDSLVSLRNIGATPKAPETPDYIKKISNYIKPNTSVVPASVASGIIPAVNKSLYTGLTENSLASSLTNPDMVKALSASTLAKNTTKALTDQATTDAVKASSQRLADNIMGNTAKSGISSLGKAGINLGASIGSELGYNWISNGLSTGAGQMIKNIGSAAGTALQFIPGVGWAAAPIVTLASGILGGIANQWGHKTFDNGATAYTNRLNTMNPNGSNEYLANLLANTGIGPRATYKDGWFTDKGKREARNINNMQDLAYSRFQRGIRDAFANNNTFQLWNAMNNITAMGGKLNKCKCNKKSYGGYLDSASPTGFNFLSDLTNIQMQKNQNQGGTATSVGNSFMNTPDMGITFAKGGIMIKPENRGKLTRLKKRTGKTEAELYNDGNPEHRKMVVFALNSRRWHKHALGGYLKGKVYDIPEEEVQRLIRAGYEVEYL